MLIISINAFQIICNMHKQVSNTDDSGIYKSVNR